MTELTRNEIVRRWRAGASIRRIARELGLARNTVSRVLRQVEGPAAPVTTARAAAGGPACSILTSRSSRNCWPAIPT